MQGDEKQKQGQSIEDTKETAGRTEEQGSFEEKERKSYGRKGKSPFLLFFVLLPFLQPLSTVFTVMGKRLLQIEINITEKR